MNSLFRYCSKLLQEFTNLFYYNHVSTKYWSFQFFCRLLLYKNVNSTKNYIQQLIIIFSDNKLHNKFLRKSYISTSSSTSKALAMVFNVSIVGFLLPFSICDRYALLTPDLEASWFILIFLYFLHARIG